ncbi:uncharacterized protein TNCV_2923701 [Trichonephila clavipes]|nr:uncharacterized protein TNCV_2923701 [Trichonephila clavipes]
MPNHKIFQRLHRKFRETRSFHVTKHDAGRRRFVRSSCLKESNFSIMADRPKPSVRAVVDHVSVSHQMVCRVLHENHLQLVHFQRVEAKNPAGYLRLSMRGTTMSAAAGLHSSCAN